MIKEFTTAVTTLFKGLDDPNYKKIFYMVSQLKPQ